MFLLKLMKGLSYKGLVYATRARSEVLVEDQATADALVASGYFDLLDEIDYTRSTFTRDPSRIGGVNCNIHIDGHTAYASGQIEYYPADESLDREAGCRVGFEICAPDDLENVDGASYEYEGRSGLVVDDIAKDPRKMWWYPLVEDGVGTRSISIDWDGDGLRPAETFAVHFRNITVQSPPAAAGEAAPAVGAAPAAAALSATVPQAVEDEIAAEEARLAKLSRAKLDSIAQELEIDTAEAKNRDEVVNLIIAQKNGTG